MEKQLFYEDVEVGNELPSLVKKPSHRQLVMWAGASEDYYEIHYDKDFAQSTGLQDIIVHGRIKAAFLGQLLTDWVGGEGNVKKLTCSYRGMDLADQEMVCKGKVTRKHVEGDEHIVECEIWTENTKGEKTTPGTGVVVFPSRAKV